MAIFRARNRFLSSRLTLTCYVLLLLTVVREGHGYWWLLGTPAVYQSTLELKPTNYKQKCAQLTELMTLKQRELCGVNHNVLRTVSKGAKLGIEECQHQFKDRRWNCTTYDDERTVFGSVLSINSREKAYIYAISSSGVTVSITRACSKGELAACNCDESVRTIPTRGRWEWGGCSDDVRFGEKFASEFIDSRDRHRASAESLMNLHNNKAGRKSIYSTMTLSCKCHGVSGSCSMKVCWRALPAFRKIGALLKDRFDGATLVKMARRKQKLRPKVKEQKKPTKKDLVYLEESPDFCERNLKFGSLGTHGRQCNQTSLGTDGCQLMCCGRGYTTLVATIKEECDCKFIWCCDVKCKSCTRTVEKHYCN